MASTSRTPEQLVDAVRRGGFARARIHLDGLHLEIERTVLASPAVPAPAPPAEPEPVRAPMPGRITAIAGLDEALDKGEVLLRLTVGRREEEVLAEHRLQVVACEATVGGFVGHGDVVLHVRALAERSGGGKTTVGGFDDGN